jgi:hypothetical protein
VNMVVMEIILQMTTLISISARLGLTSLMCT